MKMTYTPIPIHLYTYVNFDIPAGIGKERVP